MPRVDFMSPRYRLPRFALLFVVCAALPLAMHALAPRRGAPSLLAELAAACTDGRPYLVTSCYAPTAGDPAPSLPSLVLFRDTPDDAGQRLLAGHAQVGSTWGLAYDGAGGALYAGAFRKRGVALGPGGEGAIYRLDLASGELRLFARLPGVDDHGGGDGGAGGSGGDGSEARGPARSRAEADPADALALREAGRRGLGDLDLDSRAGLLFAVDLSDRRIHRLDLADGRHLGSQPHGAAAEPWAAEARPFGLAVHGDRLYHALVRTAELSGRAADLEARVYSSRYDGADLRLEARLPLAGERGLLRQTPGGPAESLAWQPWTDALPPAGDGPWLIGPQPLAADIAFTADGDLALGLRDRLVDMSEPALAAGLPLALGLGDLRLARRTDEGWQFLPEEGRFTDAVAGSDQAAQGGLAAWTAGRALISAELARLPSLSAGSAMRAAWYASADGQRQAAEGICPGGALLPSAWGRPAAGRAPLAVRPVLADTTSFSSARSSGDLELLCDAPDSAPDGPPRTDASPLVLPRLSR